MQQVQAFGLPHTNLGGRNVVLNVIEQSPPNTHFSLYPDFKSGQARFCGIAQIILGVASIVFEVFKCCGLGYAFFTPVIWFISAGFLLAAACSKDIWKITTSYVINIISALTSLYFIPLAAVDVHYGGSRADTIVAMSAMILVVGIIEGCVAVRSVQLCYLTVRSIRSTTENNNGAIQQYIICTGTGHPTVNSAIAASNINSNVQVEPRPIPQVAESRCEDSPPDYNTLRFIQRTTASYI